MLSSGRSREGGRALPLFLNQTEDWETAPRYLRVWMTAPTPPPPSHSRFPPSHLFWRSGFATAVFLPSQCWYTRFGDLTAINKIGSTRRWARSWKNSIRWKSANHFWHFFDTVALDQWFKTLTTKGEIILPSLLVLLLNENEWHNSVLRQLTMISTDPCRHNLKTLFPFLVAKLHINIIMDDKKITIILFLFKNEQYFYI